MPNISDFKAQLTGGGARANQFRVFLTFPGYVAVGAYASAQAQFLCHAASLPQSTVADIEVAYRGRPVHFAGERTFAPWSVSVYNDTNFLVRDAMEVWSNGIQNNAGTNGFVNPLDYQVDLTVQQLDRSGDIIKTYVFKDAYPTEVGDITLGYDQGTQIESFNVTFLYNYWVSNTTELLPDGGADFSQPITPGQ
jgi:hypothetical protein